MYGHVRVGSQKQAVVAKNTSGQLASNVISLAVRVWLPILQNMVVQLGQGETLVFDTVGLFVGTSRPMGLWGTHEWPTFFSNDGVLHDIFERV